jgi:predicted nucleotidyltransferase
MEETYKKYNDCLTKLINTYKERLGRKVVAVLLSGSLAKRTLVKDWSDLDLTVICEDTFFDTQRKLSSIKREVEETYNIHIGQYLASLEELASSNVQVGGLKLLLTKQHLHLKYAYFVYLRDGVEPRTYAPTLDEIAFLAIPEMYRYHNVLRKTLRDQEGMALTKMSIKCVFLVIRLALASMKIICPTYESVIQQAPKVFKDAPLNFRILEKANKARYEILTINDYNAMSKEFVNFVEDFVTWYGNNKNKNDS